jgi:hypothetical protein
MNADCVTGTGTIIDVSPKRTGISTFTSPLMVPTNPT